MSFMQKICKNSSPSEPKNALPAVDRYCCISAPTQTSSLTD